nr:ABC transporter ATP-binding protein [Candidatus Sigynarchaeota archaeon]
MGTILQVKNITKRFGGLTAVNDVNFEIEQGSMVGMIGPNGAGKTTLFNIISGFTKQSTGSIWFDGENIDRLKTYQRVNKGLTRTFQVVRPFRTMTLLDNVTVAALSDRGKKAFKDFNLDKISSNILSQVGLIDKARLPPLILPHGDLRRAEIARALGTNPKMLLLDEPFSGLSQEEKDIISSLIVQLHNEGYTILIVEHVLRELMKIVSRVIALNRGMLIADGKPEDVVKNKTVIEAYLGSAR